MDAWLLCQQGWLYLEPIFGSEDIMQQMPNEGRKFKAVDTVWRQTMEQLSKNPEVLTVCSDNELLNSLKEANKLLEQVNLCFRAVCVAETGRGARVHCVPQLQ
jgi:dynein heavy chain